MIWCSNLSGGAPLFIMCLCQEKMRPVHLYHRVYLVDRTFLVQKYIFSCLPGTIRHSLVLQSKYTVWIFTLNNSVIWLIKTKPQNKQMHG